MIQIYGRKKCSITRKAQRFFSDRGVSVQSIDLDQKTPGKRELELFAQVAGEDALVDTQSKAYQSRGLAYMEFDLIEELTENTGLLRTPIVRSGRTVVVGSDEQGWKSVMSEVQNSGGSQ